MFDLADQDRACAKLISGVLGLAIRDACLSPVRDKKKQWRARWEAVDAIAFIDNDESLGFWCEMLSINMWQFRRGLMRLSGDRTEDKSNPINQKMRRAYGANRSLIRLGRVIDKPRCEMSEEEIAIDDAKRRASAKHSVPA